MQHAKIYISKSEFISILPNIKEKDIPLEHLI